MEEWKQRLRSAREAKGMTKTAFANAVGVSNATVTDWEKSIDSGGIKEISGPKLTKVSEVLEIDPRWLMDGRQANQQRNLTDLVPNAIRVREEIPDESDRTHIWKVKLRIQAGITGFRTEPEDGEGDSYTVPTQWIYRNNYRSDALIAIVVKGESMEPALYEGDVIVVDTADTKLSDGAVYVVNYEGEAVVKRLSRDQGQWWLTSDNADQRKYHRKLCKGAECIIIGRVVRKESTHI